LEFVQCHGVGFVALDFTPADRYAEGPQVDGSGGGGGGAEAAAQGPAGDGGLDWSRPFDYGADEQREIFDWVGSRTGETVLYTLIAALVALIVGWTVITASRQARRSPLIVRAPRGVSRKTLSFYVRWLRACAAKGHVRRHSQTPREFLRSLPEELRAAGLQVTAQFERARYGAEA